MQWLSTYTASSYKGKTLLFKAGEEDHEISNKKFNEWSHKQFLDPSNGWGNILSNLKIYHARGTHTTLLEGTNSESLVNQVKKALDDEGL